MRWCLSLLLLGAACTPARPRAPLAMEPIERSAPPPAEEPVAEERPVPTNEPPPARVDSPKALGCGKAAPTRETLELAVGETKTLSESYEKYTVTDETIVTASPADHRLVLEGKKHGDTQVWASTENHTCTVFEVSVYARRIGSVATAPRPRG